MSGYSGVGSVASVRVCVGLMIGAGSLFALADPEPWNCAKTMLFTVVATTAMQMATLYVPVLNAVFKTEPLAPAELALCLVLAGLVFAGVEAKKWAMRRGWIYRANP